MAWPVFVCITQTYYSSLHTKYETNTRKCIYRSPTALDLKTKKTLNLVKQQCHFIWDSLTDCVQHDKSLSLGKFVRVLRTPWHRVPKHYTDASDPLTDGSYNSMVSGFSMNFLNSASHWAPTAPSTTRWSQLRVTDIMLAARYLW